MNKLSLVLYVTFLIVVSGLRISDVVEIHSVEAPKHQTEEHHHASTNHNEGEDTGCRNGLHVQSPVNIVLKESKKKKHSGVLILDYKQPITGSFNWNGHTWQLNISDKSNYRVRYTDPVTVKHYEYELLQLHSHVQSEHTINGVRYPFEIHFVHKLITEDPSYQFQYLVIGILADYKSHSLKIFDQLNANQVSTISALPEVIRGHRLIHYKGSLTTPPYAEAVNWFVVRRTYFISEEKVKGFHEELKAKLGHDSNYRLTCNLDDRRLFSLRGQTSAK